MAMRRLIVELQPTADLRTHASAAALDVASPLERTVVPELGVLQLDSDFPVVRLPGLKTRSQSDSVYDVSPLMEIDSDESSGGYIVRGEVDESELGKFEKEAKKNKSVVGVYSDVSIQPMVTCPGSPPVGTDGTVERLLCVDRLHRMGLDGTGVMVAIVDSGVNMQYLNSRGKTPGFDAANSWAYQSGLTPGSMPVGHGTMCAFDACIAAPRCTLLDIALLRSVAFQGLLSDAIRAYNHLLDIINADSQRPGDNRSLVVNNSWGMFHPSWDFPTGHPGNYSDNPNHPFNRIVATLERAGADILFAAGNCGPACPDGRCQGVTSNAIYGANGHDAVLTVGGVDTQKDLVGYSSIGPGRLTRRKPDLCGYTHFRGSGVYAADGGTSAATPVVAGVIAAVRSQRPHDPSDPQTSPASIRNLLTSTAEDLGPTGFDFRHGHGVVDGCALADKLRPAPTPVPPPAPEPRVPPQWADFCRRYPWICEILFGARLSAGSATGSGGAAAAVESMLSGRPSGELSDAELGFIAGLVARESVGSEVDESRGCCGS